MRSLAVLLASLVLAPVAVAAPGDTTWISRWDATVGDANAVALSADGRYAAFSTVRPMVANDFGGLLDVYLLERATGILTLVSRSSDGLGAGNAESDGGSDPNNYLGLDLSVDGRFVVFESRASNLVAGTVEAGPADDDVFRFDRVNGTTAYVSVTPAGAPGDAFSRAAQTSGDGQVVCFVSAADDIAGATASTSDVFVRSMLTGVTSRASVAKTGSGSPNNFSERCDVSADGRFATFVSPATDIVDGFTDPQAHIYRRDLAAGVSVGVDAVAGAPANGGANFPQLSGDGSSVVFESAATNLIGVDTNLAGDSFVRALAGPTFERVSVNDDESQRLGGGVRPSISADGGRVAFRDGANFFLRSRAAGTTGSLVASDFGSLAGSGRLFSFRSCAHDLPTPPLELITDTDVDVFARELAAADDTTAPTITIGNGTATIGLDPSGVALVQVGADVVRPGATFPIAGGAILVVADGAGNAATTTVPARATALSVRVRGGKVRATFSLDATARVRIIVRRGTTVARSTVFRTLAGGRRSLSVKAPSRAGTYRVQVVIEGRPQIVSKTFRIR